MRADGFRAPHGAARIRCGNVAGIPVIAPWIGVAVNALRGQLPFPLVGKALAGPCGVGSRIFERDPRDGAIVPALRKRAVFPITEEVAGIAWSIVSGIEKLFELRMGDWMLVDEEGLDGHRVFVEASRGIFPWILHVDAVHGAAFDLGTANTEDETAAGNFYHACRRFGGRLGRRDVNKMLWQNYRLM